MINKQKNKGYTLVEFMITIVIFGIVVAYATPRFNAVQTKASVRELSESIEGGLVLARIGAISRGENVIMCPIRNAAADPTTYLDDDICIDDDWNNLFNEQAALNIGFVIFASGSDDKKIESIKNLIKVIKFNPSGGRAIVSSANQRKFVFNRKGFGIAGTIEIRPNNNLKDVFLREVVVALSGRVKNVNKKLIK